MCYSGKCFFENIMGDCTIPDYDKFEEDYGMHPCMAGNYDNDGDEVLEEHKREVIDRYSTTL